MTQRAGPMRVISVMSSLLMKRGLPACDEALRAFGAKRGDGEFQRRNLARASSRREGRRQAGDGISPGRVQNREEKPWETTKTCPGLRGHRALSLPRENPLHRRANLSCGDTS